MISHSITAYSFTCRAVRPLVCCPRSLTNTRNCLYLYFGLRCIFEGLVQVLRCIVINRKSWSRLRSAHRNRTKPPDANVSVSLTRLELKKAETESPLFIIVYRRQSSSGTLLGDSRRGTGRRWSDQASEELPSTANAAPPSCQKPQTVDIHLNSTSSRSHLKPRNASVSRRKLNTPVHTFK